MTFNKEREVKSAQEERWDKETAELIKIRNEWAGLMEKKQSPTEIMEEMFLMKKMITDNAANSEINSSDLEKFAAYHVLFGSSAEYGLSPRVDLEGELSIKKMLTQKIENLRDKESSS